MAFDLPPVKMFDCPVDGCDWHGSHLDFMAHKNYWNDRSGHGLVISCNDCCATSGTCCGQCSESSVPNIHCNSEELPVSEYSFKESRGPVELTPEAVDRFIHEHSAEYEALANMSPDLHPVQQSGLQESSEPDVNSDNLMHEESIAQMSAEGIVNSIQGRMELLKNTQMVDFITDNKVQLNREQRRRLSKSQRKHGKGFTKSQKA